MAAISAGNLHSLAMRDLISPTVTAVKPADDATGIGPGTNVSAFFSEAMTAGSIDTTTVKLFKVGEDSARKATPSPTTGWPTGPRSTRTPTYGVGTGIG